MLGFRDIPGATFLCFAFFTTVPNNGPKLNKHQKIPTFCRSYIRSDVTEIVFNAIFVFCADLRMDTLKRLVNVFFCFFPPSFRP